MFNFSFIILHIPSSCEASRTNAVKGLLFSGFHNLTYKTFGRTPWVGDSHTARLLPTQHNIKARKPQWDSISQSVLEYQKTVHTIDCMATVIGLTHSFCSTICYSNITRDDTTSSLILHVSWLLQRNGNTLSCNFHCKEKVDFKWSLNINEIMQHFSN
jgi:hypothetical protein